MSGRDEWVDWKDLSEAKFTGLGNGWKGDVEDDSEARGEGRERGLRISQ